jgi:hypothetical protein
MADIQVTVGAKNEASQILREVGNHTRILGQEIKNVGEQSQKSAQSIEISFGTLAKATAVVAGAYGAITAGGFINDFLRKSTDEFHKAELASLALSNTLSLLGDGAGRTGADFEDLVNRIEAGTNIDSTKLLGAITEGLRKGIDTTQIDEATKAAVGLSEAFGTSLADGMEKTRQATLGNFDAFTVLIPGIEAMATAEEKLAAVSQLAANGLALKKTAAGDSEQVFERMNVQMTNLYDTVGQIIEPFRDFALEGIAVTAELIDQALIPAIEDFRANFTSLGADVAASSKWFAETIVSAFTLAEVVFFNFGTVASIAGTSVLLALETMRADLEQVLTVEIPAYAIWFGENFLNILQDTASAIMTVITNLGASLGEAFVVIFDYLSGGFLSGGSIDAFAELGKIAQRDLLAGFEPVTTAMPEIAERAKTETETALEGILTDQVGDIANQFETKFNERMQAIQNNLENNPLEGNVDLKVDKQGLDSVKLPEMKSLQAFESRLLVRGPVEDVNKLIAENTAAAVAELKAINTREDRKKPATDKPVKLVPVT